MGRTRNPLGDPVRITSHRGRLIIRYYPTGLITDPNDRVRLPGSWCPDVGKEVDECERAANELRKRLYAHRAAHGHVAGLPEPQAVSLSDAAAAFLESICDDVSVGTAKAHKSKLNVLVVQSHGDRIISDLPTLVDTIIATMRAPHPDGRPKSINTREGYRSTLAVFGDWLAKTHSLANPFDGQLPPIVTRKEKKARAKARVHRANPFERSEDLAISPDHIPSLQQAVALRDAIVRRETSGAPSATSRGRGRGGGARPLTKEIAQQVAEAVTTAAATGTREAETLALHTSRIDLRNGHVVIDRQLDRYMPWLPGEEPPLVPPKHDRERTTLVWPSFLPRLRELCAYADRHNRGWLFAPTRGQRDWLKAFESMIERATQLLEYEHVEWSASGETQPEPARFPFTFHGLRHAYASYSLTPAEAGGLGWSLGLVQRCLGHSDSRTTQAVYRHITDLEFRYAAQTSHQWPGLE